MLESVTIFDYKTWHTTNTIFYSVSQFSINAK